MTGGWRLGTNDYIEPRDISDKIIAATLPNAEDYL